MASRALQTDIELATRFLDPFRSKSNQFKANQDDPMTSCIPCKPQARKAQRGGWGVKDPAGRLFPLTHAGGKLASLRQLALY
jgi:hypothetical protein